MPIQIKTRFAPVTIINGTKIRLYIREDNKIVYIHITTRDETQRLRIQNPNGVEVVLVGSSRNRRRPDPWERDKR